jgi:hypothetical protein
MGQTPLKLLFLFWLIAALAGCVTPEKKGEGIPSQPSQPERSPRAVPVITQSYASPQISPGSSWKVYLKASDADGDMKAFFCTVDQPGLATYPLSITRIKEGNQKELSGYLFLNISAFRKLDFVELTLTVEIQDRAGNFSKPANFPLFINSRYAQEPPPPGAFQENNLGPIMIELRPAGDDDRPGLFDRFRR